MNEQSGSSLITDEEPVIAFMIECRASHVAGVLSVRASIRCGHFYAQIDPPLTAYSPRVWGNDSLAKMANDKAQAIINDAVAMVNSHRAAVGREPQPAINLIKEVLEAEDSSHDMPARLEEFLGAVARMPHSCEHCGSTIQHPGLKCQQCGR